jgi:hypothetical protein
MKSCGGEEITSKIHSFLERLLLLVHITAGQPAHGSYMDDPIDS